MTRFHHVAIAVEEFENYVSLFEKLGMTYERSSGEIPHRQLWFEEGIQLKEMKETESGSSIDHIALGTDNIGQLMKIALENGCAPFQQRENWFVLPNGISVELMED